MENKTRPKKRRFDTRKKFGEKKKLCQLVEEENTEIRQNLEKVITLSDKRCHNVHKILEESMTSLV